MKKRGQMAETTISRKSFLFGVSSSLVMEVCISQKTTIDKFLHMFEGEQIPWWSLLEVRIGDKCN